MDKTLGPGPWTAAFYTALPTSLRSKSNYRMGQAGWKDIRMFEELTAMTLRAAVPSCWDLGDAKQSVSKRPTVVLAVVAASMLDSANFTKSVADAAQGVLVHSDASILATGTMALRRKTGQRCGVAAALLPPGVGVTQQAKALAQLSIEAARRFEADDPD